MYNFKVLDFNYYGYFQDDGDSPNDYFGAAYFYTFKEAWAYYKTNPQSRCMPRSRAAHPEMFVLA